MIIFQTKSSELFRKQLRNWHLKMTFVYFIRKSISNIDTSNSLHNYQTGVSNCADLSRVHRMEIENWILPGILTFKKCDVRHLWKWLCARYNNAFKLLNYLIKNNLLWKIKITWILYIIVLYSSIDRIIEFGGQSKMKN